MEDEKQKDEDISIGELAQSEDAGMVFGVRSYFGDDMEFLRAQVVVNIELVKPMQHGKRKVSFLNVTTRNADNAECIRLENGVLSIYTPETRYSDESENVPRENVVKWRTSRYYIPALPKRKGTFLPYEYSPYAYPDHVGGYLGTYSDSEGCIGFLDTDMVITVMEERRAEFVENDEDESVLLLEPEILGNAQSRDYSRVTK